MREGKTAKVQIMVEPSLVRRIDDWRFAHRVGTRSDAMRQLIDGALVEAAGQENGPAGTGIPPGHDSDNPSKGKANEHENA